jgi:hypothetical protein
MAKDNGPRRTEAENQPAMQHRHRVDQLPQHDAGQPPSQPGSCRVSSSAYCARQMNTALDAQPVAQPAGGVGDDIDRTDPAAIDPTADQQIEADDNRWQADQPELFPANGRSASDCRAT